MTHLRLGELLIQAGVLTQERLDRALREQQRSKQRLGRILVDHHLLSESDMVDALARTTGLARLDVATVTVEPAQMRSLMDPWTAERENMVPLHSDSKRRVLVVAASDPTNVALLDDLVFRSSLRVELVLGTEAEVEHLINHVFHNQHLDREFSHKVRAHGGHLPVPETDGVQPLADDLMLPELPPTAQTPVPPEPSLSELFGPLLMIQENLARELQAVFELLVEKGWMTREAYLERLTHRVRGTLD